MSEYPLMKQSIATLIKKADDELAEKLDSEGYLEPKKTVAAINAAGDTIADILEGQRDRIVAALKDADFDSVKSILETLFTDDDADVLIAETFKELFGDVIGDAAKKYLSSIDPELTLDVFSTRTTDWIDSWSKELGDIMKLGSHDKLNKILSEALENGDSIRSVTDKLVDAYEFSPMRARATAITEILTAHRASAQEAYVQCPAVEKKMWRHTGSHKNNPRPNHQAMDEQSVLKSEPYELTGADGALYYPMYPGDPLLPASERVNCHCISQAVVSSDILGLTLEERKALQQQAIDDDNAAWEKELDAKNKAKAGIDI